MTGNSSIEALQHQLALLERLIRENERIWAGFREIEVRLIGAESPEQILSVLVTDVPRIFSRVAAVSLAYVDTEPELTRLLGDQRDHFVEVSLPELHALFQPPYRPYLGASNPTILTRFFPQQTSSSGSTALVPLVAHGRLVGSLNQLSHAADHFNGSHATDLLEHLAAVLVMCLENGIARERLRQDGLTDPLTGIANRRFFDRRFREEIERCARRQEPLACMLVDIDHFKRVNDRYGHAVGDEALRLVARALLGELRATDMVARYGGEEFVLMLPDTGVEQASMIGERLRTEVAAIDFAPIGGQGRLSISIGLTCVSPSKADAATADVILRRADAALYQAKSQGRDCLRHVEL